MSEIPKLPNIAELASPIYIAFILLELYLIRRFKVTGEYQKKDAWSSIALGTGSVIFGFALALIFGSALETLYTWAYQHRLLDLSYSIPVFILCFFIDDLRYYWSHRFSHTIRWCWASHIVHHSSRQFNLSTALRQPWFDVFTGLFILRLPLIFIGFHPNLVIFAASLNLFYQFFIHTETIDKMPRWFEAVMNTPSHHRVHHGRNLRYLDANYAGTLIIWDRMFGTFVPELKEEKVDYGLVTNVDTYNPAKVAIHGYVGIAKDQLQRGLSMSDRLRYLFAPPGWSHDQSSLTTIQRKKKHLEQYPQARNTPGFK
ncbi:MAG: sterol desaturase family protein [Gammaproteobacteria bacterium]|nr:sterol desaturase family protein [Gammaproteobacteria bacterium]NNC96467.1 sterol desaturase family protein [Gammaproteobacteria bacterium]NNM14988.1 sterol desaturase family protein [Gammaproteobacteria bacterium]